jgi:hypothetical protein
VLLKARNLQRAAACSRASVIEEIEEYDDAGRAVAYRTPDVLYDLCATNVLKVMRYREKLVKILHKTTYEV